MHVHRLWKLSTKVKVVDFDLRHVPDDVINVDRTSACTGGSGRSSHERTAGTPSFGPPSVPARFRTGEPYVCIFFVPFKRVCILHLDRPLRSNLQNLTRKQQLLLIGCPTGWQEPKLCKRHLFGWEGEGEGEGKDEEKRLKEGKDQRGKKNNVLDKQQRWAAVVSWRPIQRSW